MGLDVGLYDRQTEAGPTRVGVIAFQAIENPRESVGLDAATERFALVPT